MSTLTVTAKGRVTLRRDLLRHLAVQPGEKIIVDTLPGGRIQIRASLPTGKISDVFDFLKRENYLGVGLGLPPAAAEHPIMANFE